MYDVLVNFEEIRCSLTQSMPLMQACCCQVTGSVVSLYSITSNQDAESISDEPEILSGGRSESRYHTADAEIETSIDGVSCGDGVFHSHQGEVWGGCHAHCPAKFLIFRFQKD